MMTPVDALREQVQAFVNGEATLRGLCAWLGQNVDEIEGSGDSDAQDLAGEVWALSSELGHGHRDEESARLVLATHLLGPLVHVHGISEPREGVAARWSGGMAWTVEIGPEHPSSSASAGRSLAGAPS